MRLLRTCVACLIIAVALASCGGSKNDGGTAAGTTSKKLEATFGKAAGPVDHLNWGLPYGEPPTVDPPNTAYYSSAFAAAQMCDTLLRFNPDFTYRPGLADVKQTDPLTIVIDLKKGIKFWDGEEMTSADVKYSLDRARDPKNIVGFLFGAIKSVDATSRYQVKIHFKQPDEVVIKELPSFSGMVYEKKFAEKAGKQFGTSKAGVMCSGPYKFSSWKPGSQMELVANENYWDPAYKPHAKTVTLKFFSDSTTLASSLISGEIDGAYEVPAQTLPSLEKAKSGTLHFGRAPLYLSMSWTRPDGPLADPKLREALFETVDRAALARVVFHDAASPNYTLLNTNTWDPEARDLWKQAYGPFEEDGKTWGTPQALKASKKLVQESGYKGEPVVFTTPAGDVTINQIAQLVQQQAKQIGVDVKINRMQATKYAESTTDPKLRESMDLTTGVSFNVAADPLEPIPFNVLPGSFYNYTNYKDPEVTRLITQAKQTLDAKKRNEMTIKAQSIYEKDYRGTSLVEINEISFLNKRLSGMTTSFTYMNTPSLATIGAAK